MKLFYFIITFQFILILPSCQWIANHKIDTDIDFNRILVESETDRAIFNLSDLLNTESDLFTIIQPYTYLDRLSDSTGINFMSLENTGIETRDDLCVLVLIKNNYIFDHYLLYFQRVKLSGFDDFVFYDIETPLILRKQDEKYLIETL